MFNEHPVELGLSGREDKVLHRLRADPDYPRMFSAAFPENPDPASLANVTLAIASFERTLVSATCYGSRRCPGTEWRDSPSRPEAHPRVDAQPPACSGCRCARASATSAGRSRPTAHLEDESGLKMSALVGELPTDSLFRGCRLDKPPDACLRVMHGLSRHGQEDPRSQDARQERRDGPARALTRSLLPACTCGSMMRE